MKKETAVTFALAREGGVEWYYPEGRPGLTTDQAIGGGINRVAGPMQNIADAVSGVAEAIERLAATVEDKNVE